MKSGGIKTHSRGQVLVGVILILLVLAISLPALISLVKQEGKETVKIRRSSTAFHLAETGASQGVWKLQESVTTWTNAAAGTVIADYDGTVTFSMVFSDGKGGDYNIRFSSGPSTNQVTILAKGRDSSTQEIRAVQTVVARSPMEASAIQAKQTSSFGAATSVEWGPVISKTSIDSGGKTHPRMYSAGNIVGKDANGSVEPNTDSLQWWSYKPDLPPDPDIDFSYYKAQAQGFGASADADCGNYYKNAAFNFRGCQDVTGRIFYIEGNVDFQAGAGGNYIACDLIILGNFGITGNGGSNGNVAASVPSTAWKEYGNDWNHYTSNFDPTCIHATYAAAQNADYAPTGLTKNLSNVLINGFIYTGGSQGLTGGGNANMIGTLYSANNTSMTTSNCTLYYSPSTLGNVKTTNVILTRSSWKEVTGQSWP